MPLGSSIENNDNNSVDCTVMVQVKFCVINISYDTSAKDVTGL